MLSEHKYERFTDFLRDWLKQVQEQSTALEAVHDLIDDKKYGGLSCDCS